MSLRWFKTFLLTGYCEVDQSLEWEASYPNDITHTAPTTVAALKTQVCFETFCSENPLSSSPGSLRQLLNLPDQKTSVAMYSQSHRHDYLYSLDSLEHSNVLV